MKAGELLWKLWLLPNFSMLKRASWSERSRMGVLGFAGLSFLGVLYGIFKPVVRQFASAEQLGPLLLQKLVYIFLTLLLVILVLSNIITMLGRLVQDDDAELLLSSPLNPASYFKFKYWQAALSSGWMTFPLWLPLLFAIRKALKLDYLYVLNGLVAVIPLGWLASSLACLFLIGALRFIPPFLLKRVMLMIGTAFGCGVILLIRLVQPEKLANPESAQTTGAFLEQLKIPEPAWNPATLVSQAVTTTSLTPLFSLLVACVLLYLLAMIVGGNNFWSLWLKARGLSENRGVEGKKGTGSWFRSGGAARAMATRQLLALLRYPGHKVQVLFLGVLILLFLYNIYKLPWDDAADLRSLLFRLSCLFSQLIVVAVCARFFFPTPSVESKQIWLELSSPQSSAGHAWARLLPALVVAVGLSLALGLTSYWILQPPSRLLKTGLFFLLTMPVSAACMAVGLGVRWASPDYKQPDQALTGSSGVMVMVLSVASIFALAGLMYLFGWEWYMSGLVKKAQPRIWTLIVLGSMWLLVYLSSTVLPMWLAKRRLERWDL